MHMNQSKEQNELFASSQSTIDEHQQFTIQHWLLGVCVPSAAIMYGVYCIYTKTALLPYDDGIYFKRYEFLHLQGRAAVAMGLLVISIGLHLFSLLILKHFYLTRLLSRILSFITLAVGLICIVSVAVFVIFEMLI